MKKRATTASLVLLVFSLGALHQALMLPFGRVSAPAPGFSPTILAALLALLSAFALFASLRDSDAGLESSTPMSLKKIFCNLAALAAFALVLESLGFLPTTLLLLMFTLRYVEKQSWALSVSVAFGAALVSYVVLKRLLGVPLPGGLFAS